MNAEALIIIGVSLICSAFFSGLEIAFISSNKLKIELDSKQGHLNARILSFFASKSSSFIGTMLLGNNVALVVYGIAMARAMEPSLINWVGDNEGLILLLQTIVSTLLVLITAEFLPKTVFRINPNKILSFFAIPLLIIYWLLWIPVFLTIGFSELVIGLFIKKDSTSDKVVFGKVDLDDYLSEVAEIATENDEIDYEVRLFQNALNFSKVIARDCMIPRNEIVSVEIGESIEDLKKMFTETGLSKILVYRDSIDNIIGYTHSFELLKEPASIKSILLPINIVPETVTVDKALNDLLESNRSIAVVVDEFGGTSGMFTTEDIMEEIFGEIEDEHDVEELTEQVLEDGSYVFSARIEIDYLNEKYKLKIPESEEYETLAGYIINAMEDIPDAMDLLEIDEFDMRILEVSENRIDLVKLLPKNKN
ncbi:MAG TPA: hemolysin [Flavobacteriales bacterium]|nr:hemolysin [Crocinitomicaceae bacterium]HAE30109.1 hemolysin [Flavobacteriales bacterium]